MKQMRSFTSLFLVILMFSLNTIDAQTRLLSDTIRINHLQIIGSHNSYKQKIYPPIMDMIAKEDSSARISLDYSHIPLSDQLNLGLRNLEIDIYYDPDGGRYSHPLGLEMLKKMHYNYEPFDTLHLMDKPGYKVMHIQDIDFRSNCYTLKNCLHELKTWSDKHPDHLPIIITMNAKDEIIDKPGFTKPLGFDEKAFDDLDKEIADNLTRSKLLTPDDVRGSYSTLEEAVLADNWPTLEKARGKFIFVLDEGGDKRKTYINNHPSLRGRILFTDSPEGTPEAAIMIMNNPVEQENDIRDMVKKGYIVRTRADAGTIEARQNNYKRFKAAKQSDAQIITTDYYLPNPEFGTGYKIIFDDGSYFRLNPLFNKDDNKISLE